MFRFGKPANPACKMILRIIVSILFVTFGLTTTVLAGGDVDLNGIIKGYSSLPIPVGTTVYVELTDLDEKYGGNDFSEKYILETATVKWTIGEKNIEPELKELDEKLCFTYTITADDAGKTIRFFTLSADTHYNNNTDAILISSDTGGSGGSGGGSGSSGSGSGGSGGSGSGSGSASASTKIEYVGLDSTGILTVKGNTTGSATFVRLLVDGTVETYLTGKKSFEVKIDTKDYPVGYHDLKAEMSDGKAVYAATAFPTNIYDVPVLKKDENFFSVGSNYISFRPYFTVPSIYDGVYIQFKTGKTWGDVYGPFQSYEILRTNYFVGSKKKPGIKIKSNTTYTARAFFAKKTQYGGKAYYMYGPMSNEITFKTGKGKKPAVKSIKISNVRQKKIKLIQHAHWDASGYWHPYKEDYTWTTIFKVTVTLKKKPGTKGIYIGQKKVRGNKTKYSATFEESGKWKGKNIKVDVCTYNDKGVGAYSPVLRKSVRVG